MKILFDIGHPAHVHLFRFVANELLEKGHPILFSVRSKAETLDLLKAYQLPYSVYEASKKNIFGKLLSYWVKLKSLNKIMLAFNPSITISHSSFYLSQVSWWHKIPNITLEDTGNMEQVALYLPFTSIILTPEAYNKNHGSRQLSYNGFHESAYINSDTFNEQFRPHKDVHANTVLIRLVDWSASHDLAQHGISIKILDELIGRIPDKYQIKILSEGKLPKHLEHFALKIKPDELHAFLGNVVLYIGEGATLASECALLGIPTIYINSRKAGVIDVKANAGLIYHFRYEKGLIDKTLEILNSDHYQNMHRELAIAFQKNKINLSKFLVWFIENYPTSARTLKENPDYQYNLNDC